MQEIQQRRCHHTNEMDYKVIYTVAKWGERERERFAHLVATSILSFPTPKVGQQLSHKNNTCEISLILW